MKASKSFDVQVIDSFASLVGTLGSPSGPLGDRLRVDQHRQACDWERREEKNAERASERGEEECEEDTQ